MRKFSLSLLLFFGFLLSPFVATDFTHKTVPSNNFLSFYANGLFWTYNHASTPITELKAYDSDANFTKSYTYNKRYYIGGGAIEKSYGLANYDVVLGFDRNNNKVAFIDLSTGEVYANASATSLRVPTGIYHISEADGHDDTYWVDSYGSYRRMLIDTNGTIIDSIAEYADYSFYDSGYAYLITNNISNSSSSVHKLQLTVDGIINQGISIVNLGGCQLDYMRSLSALSTPRGYQDYLVFTTQDENRSNMQIIVYSMSTNSVVDVYNTTTSFVKSLYQTVIWNPQQGVFNVIMVKDYAGDIVIATIDDSNGEIINVLEKNLYGATSNEYVVNYVNNVIIPVDVGNNALSFVMTTFTSNNIEEILTKSSVLGKMHNLYEEFLLVEANDTDIRTTHLFTEPVKGDWWVTFNPMGATDGNTVLFTSGVTDVNGVFHYYADFFNFSGGSDWSNGYSVPVAGVSMPFYTESFEFYGALTQTDFKLKDAVSLFVTHNDVIVNGNCETTQLQFRPILSKTYDFEEYYFYVMDEKVSCISGWTVYNRTGEEYVGLEFGDFGDNEVRAINYTGVASGDITLLIKICGGGICNIGEWGSASSDCSAIPVITYPVEGANISRPKSQTTINAVVSLVDAYENCSLETYTAEVYLDSGYIDDKTQAESYITLSVPDDTSYLVEAKATGFPSHYFAGNDASTNFAMTASPAFVPDYEIGDLFPQVIDVIAGIGNELSDNSIALGGLLFLGLTVAVVAWVSFKKKK